MRSGDVVAGRYQLESRLGVGGMGEVWRSTHTGTGRAYAIKFMHAHTASSATARERFSREARASAKINHPNVVDVYDVGELEDGTLYLVMELLDGLSLADALHATPPLSVEDLMAVMLDAVEALAAAHAVGIVHRDIKPANIFLHKDRATGLASGKILDFGISKFSGNENANHTRTGAVLGSPRYMSPEQTRSSAAVDARTDVWAAGVILFEALTGTWPHDGDSFSSLVLAIITQPPLSIDQMAPDLPEPVRAIVRDCLKPLGERLRDGTELAQRIAAAIGDPTLARRPLPRPLNPPSEGLKSTTGIRVRPPAAKLLTTSQSGAQLRSDLGLSPSAVMPAPAAVPVPAMVPPQAGLSPAPRARTMRMDEAQARAFVAGAATTSPEATLALDSPLAAAQMAAPAPLAQSYPNAAAPNLPPAQPAQPLTQSWGSPPASARAPGAPTAPFPQANAFAQSHPNAPAVRPPDPLVKTTTAVSVETTSTTGDRALPPSTSPAPAPLAAEPLPAPSSGKGLRVLAAVLAVALCGIVAAIVASMGNKPTTPPTVAATATATPPALPATTAAPPAEVAPTATTATPPPPPETAAPVASAVPTASASTTAAPSAQAAAAPAPAGKAAAPAGKGKTGISKIQQLGSGL